MEQFYVTLYLTNYQGSKAPPWWLSHFLVSERVLFGTWDGVFTSCLINIFGVIIFLRSGWIVAEAGIGHAALIVLAGVALILMAVLSAIGICERCHVQSGGVYFLIAHVLGSRRGAAVGIIYVIGQVRASKNSVSLGADSGHVVRVKSSISREGEPE